MSIKRARFVAVAVITTAALTLTGCTSGPVDGPNAADKETVEATASPEAEATEPPPSPAQIERFDDKGKPTKTNYRLTVIGTDRYDVATSGNIDGATGLAIGNAANAIIREHVLRRDRWVGKYVVKGGELDAFREKVTPELYAKVAVALASVDVAIAKYGRDPHKAPKKVLKDVEKDAQIVSDLYLNTSLTDGGEGDIVVRSTKRDLFNSEKSGEWKGAPVTYSYFTATRKNGTGTARSFSIWQAWKKVQGEWIVFDTDWDLV